MAAGGDRTLKLSLLADTKNLVDGLNKGAKATDSFGKQIGDISAKVVKSFALIGTAVAGLSVVFAKAAAEDQQAANRLAQTLGTVTTATQKQIGAVDQWITKTSVATGIADDELRPAFERLARSTKSVEESQQLLNLALDLSAATGKPLEAVTNSLAKAYDGSYTSLQRLGLGIDANLIKAKDFDGIYRQLNSTFGEFSEKRSEEALVKFQRLQVALQEAKEAVGAALLPVFIQLGDWLLNEGVPRLNAFVAGLVGDKSLSYSFSVAQKDAEAFGQKIRGVIDKFIEYKDVLLTVAGVVGTIFVVSKIAAGVQATILLVKGLISAYNALRVSAMAAGIATAFALNPAAGIAAGAAAIAGMGLLIQKLNDQSGLIGGDFSDGGVGLGNRPLGGGGRIGGKAIDENAGITSFGGGGGGSTARSLSEISGGMVTSPEDLVNRLTNVSDRISQIQFLYDTGQISKAKAQSMLDSAQKEFTKLERIGNEFVNQNQTPSPSAPMGATGRGEYANVTINVMAPTVMDETGFVRAVQSAISSVERRGTAAYSGGL
jgi:hypothetical protein